MHLCLFLNVFMFVCCSVLGDIEPTLYQRECSCSQMTLFSSLFTEASEGGSQCRSCKHAATHAQKWTHTKEQHLNRWVKGCQRGRKRLAEIICSQSATEMLEKPEGGRGGTTVSRWDWQSKGKKCWVCWERESQRNTFANVILCSPLFCGVRRGSNGDEQHLRGYSGLRRTPTLLRFTAIFLLSYSSTTTLRPLHSLPTEECIFSLCWSQKVACLTSIIGIVPLNSLCSPVYFSLFPFLSLLALL